MSKSTRLEILEDCIRRDPDSVLARAHKIESTPVMWGAPPTPSIWQVCAFHFTRSKITIDSARMEGTIVILTDDLGHTTRSVIYHSGHWRKGEVVLSTDKMSYKDVISQNFYWDVIRPHTVVYPKYKDIIRLYRPVEEEKILPF